MSRYVFAVLVLSGLSFHHASAQRNRDLERRITLLVEQLASYDTLSPFDEGDPERIDSLQNTILSGLVLVLKDPKLGEADIARLSNAQGMMQEASEDGRVRSFAIDEKPGAHSDRTGA